MFIAQTFLKSLVKSYDKHEYTQMENMYPEACSSIGLEHRLHTPFKKNIIERSIQYFKYETECFNDYYFCIKSGCNILYVYKWARLFMFMRNAAIRHIKSLQRVDEGVISLNTASQFSN
jgi:hypothetical protein